MEGKYTKSDNTQIPRKLKTLLYIIEVILCTHNCPLSTAV